MFEKYDGFELRLVMGNDKIVAGVVVVLLSVVVIAVTATGTAAAQSAPDCSTVSYNGSGASSNPYEIGNVSQLQCVESQGLDANYALVSDINASETQSWNEDRGFKPIGNPLGGNPSGYVSESEPFNGIVDGAGHNITGLYINRQSKPRNVGLFGVVGGSGTATNLSVVEASVTGSSAVGGLVGQNRGTVRDTSVSGNVTGSNQISSVGGLVGSNSGTVTDSSMSGNVIGDSIVGQLVGNNDDGIVRKASASGNVIGDSIVGGLVGSNLGKVQEAYSTASVKGKGEFKVGGLVGSNLGGTVVNSSASGEVEGNDRVGGLVGVIFHGGTVSESYAVGSVTGNTDVGGLVGENDNGSINKTYAAGSITGDTNVGGIVGKNEDKVTNSYWDTRATGQSKSDGGTRLTTEEMTGEAARNNMGAFDFETTWFVPGSDEYPDLRALQEGEAVERNNGTDSGTSEDENVTENDDSEGLPGFTAALAVLALCLSVGLLALSRRRD